MSGHRPGVTVRRLLRASARLYDWKLGWLLSNRFLRLTHVGRRSGRHHQTVLEVIGRGTDPPEVMVIAGLGSSADWYRNIQAGPAVEIAIGGLRFRPTFRVLDEFEAMRTLAEYERRNRWAAPVVRRVISWLVGWRYDGTDNCRRRLVDELPIIAFRPATSGR